MNYKKGNGLAIFSILILALAYLFHLKKKTVYLHLEDFDTRRFITEHLALTSDVTYGLVQCSKIILLVPFYIELLMNLFLKFINFFSNFCPRYTNVMVLVINAGEWKMH